MRKFTASLAMSVACAASAGSAQTPLNATVADFSNAMFSDCIEGENLGQAFGASNPAGLLGAIVYTVPNAAGVRTWRREPLQLPVTATEVPDVNRTTCRVRFEATADGTLNVLGLSFTAARADVYEMRVRQILRQQLSPVVQGDISVQVWRSTKYRPIIGAVMAGISTSAADISIIDNTTTYLLEIERYRRTGAGGSGNFSIFGTSARYQRDETFEQTRIIVTGDRVELLRASYPPPARSPSPTPTAPR